jgi:uncharacterized protein (TIGR02246 family)
MCSKKLIKLTLPVLMMLMLIISCKSTQEGNQTVYNAISDANEKFMTAFNQGDAVALAALYTEDGKILPPNGDFVVGKEAIQSFWQSLVDMGIKKAKLEVIEVEGLGNTAIEVSKYTMYGAEGQPLDNGKYIVIWKKVDGQWKLHRDIFNSSLPVQTQE